MTYYIRRRWEDGDTTINELGFATIEEAAEFVYKDDSCEGNVLRTSWVYQVFCLETDGKDIVTGAKDVTAQARQLIIDMWKANEGNWEFYPQLIANYVDENYTRLSNRVLVCIDDIDDVSIAEDNRLTIGDVL